MEGTKEGEREEVCPSDRCPGDEGGGREGGMSLCPTPWVITSGSRIGHLSVMGSVRKWFAYTAGRLFLSGARDSWHEFDCIMMQ